MDQFRQTSCDGTILKQLYDPYVQENQSGITQHAQLRLSTQYNTTRLISGEFFRLPDTGHSPK